MGCKVWRPDALSRLSSRRPDMLRRGRKSVSTPLIVLVDYAPLIFLVLLGYVSVY